MKRFIVFFLFLIFVPVFSARAFTFNPDNIITDFELKDKDSMSLSAIQSFLEKHESALKNYSDTVDGVLKNAAEIIHTAAQVNGISPKFILTKLDHEQCLVRGCSYHKDPVKLQKALDFAAGFGVCDGCNIKDPKIQKYKGFARQVEALASVQNDYIRKAGRGGIRAKGQIFKTQDGFTITPVNQATANLYNYTPYRGGAGNNIGGNYFFAKLWDQYWGSLLYPDGSVLTDGNSYWLIDGGAKRRYGSSSVFFSERDSRDAITISGAVLEEYPDGHEIKFSNYSLVQDETGERYLLVNGRKRKIDGDETFRLLGFNPEEVETVNSNELSSYPPAVQITKDEVYPQGALVKATNGEFYFIQNGFKYPVHSEITALNYPNLAPGDITREELARYYAGTPQKINEGKFIKSREGVFYIVSRGILRPIASVQDFIALFGEQKLSDVVEVSTEVIALHKIGETIATGSYERNDEIVPPTLPVVATTPRALWVNAESPQSVISGASFVVPVRFKNKSDAQWGKGDVYLLIKETQTRKENNDIVPKDVAHTFAVPLILETKGDATLTFQLYTKDGSEVKGGLYQTRVFVKEPDYKARIVSHTIPSKIKQGKTPVKVEVRIKNDGSKPWIRRKTGLKVSNSEGGASPFYDASDWLDIETASVSLDPKKDAILPGETAVFRFTLKTDRALLAAHTYRLSLFMTDKKEIINLNGKDFWEGTLRVER